MKALRARIGADTVDPITSFVIRVNFALEIIENGGFFTDKMESLHRAVLVSNPKGMWRLELSIHCALSLFVNRLVFGRTSQILEVVVLF